MGHGPGCGKSKINFAKINQNYDYFQAILEQLVDEFNQKWSPKCLIFAKKIQNFPNGRGQSPQTPVCDTQPLEQEKYEVKLFYHKGLESREGQRMTQPELEWAQTTDT